MYEKALLRILHHQSRANPSLAIRATSIKINFLHDQVLHNLTSLLAIPSLLQNVTTDVQHTILCKADWLLQYYCTNATECINNANILKQLEIIQNVYKQLQDADGITAITSLLSSFSTKTAPANISAPKRSKCPICDELVVMPLVLHGFCSKKHSFGMLTIIAV